MVATSTSTSSAPTTITEKTMDVKMVDSASKKNSFNKSKDSKNSSNYKKNSNNNNDANKSNSKKRKNNGGSDDKDDVKKWKGTTTNNNKGKQNQHQSKHGSSTGGYSNNTNKNHNNKKYTTNDTNNNNKKTTTNTTNQQQYSIKVRKHADVVIEGKRVWNLLRMKSNTKEIIRTLMENELMPLLRPSQPQPTVAGSGSGSNNNTTTTTTTGSKIIKEICLQHDAARIVQAAIQFGTISERNEIVTDILADPTYFIELCKSQYGHFVILKLIKYCCSTSNNNNNDTTTTTGTKKIKSTTTTTKNRTKIDVSIETKITRALNGHVVKLAFHAIASRVIELIFTTPFSTTNLAVLKQELYGPHCALLLPITPLPLTTTSTTTTVGPKTIVPTLRSNLQLLPDKADHTMEYFRTLLHKGIGKTFYSFTFFQQMLYEYFDLLQHTNKTNEIRDFVSTTSIADHVLELLVGKVGTSVVCTMIAYATVKDRKRIIRSFKGYTRSGLSHKDAYLSLCRLVQLVDDTVLIQKNILTELLTRPALTTTNKSTKTKTSNKDDKDGTTTILPAVTTMTEFTERTKDMANESPLLQIALSDTGSKFLRMLLIPNDNTNNNQDTTTTTTPTINNDDEIEYFNKIFDPYERTQLFFNPTIVEKNSDGIDEIIPTSKKDNPIRRRDLLKTLEQPLLDMCTNHIEQLVRSIPGSMVVRDVYRQFRPVPSLTTSIVNLFIAKDNDEEEMDSSSTNNDTQANNNSDDIVKNKMKGKLPIYEDRTSFLALKYIILLDTGIVDGSDDVVHDKKLTLASSVSTKTKGSEETAVQLLKHLLDHDRVLHEMSVTNRGCLLLSATIQVVLNAASTAPVANQELKTILSMVVEKLPASTLEKVLAQHDDDTKNSGTETSKSTDIGIKSLLKVIKEVTSSIL